MSDPRPAPQAEPPPLDEIERLAALARYEILDTPREQDFDDIAELAAEICDTPIGVVNLVGEGRQWFKAEVGLGVRETPLATSFCGHAILEHEIMVVPDATRDPRFATNPLITGEPHLRFYAGALLKTDEGHAIGTLCVLDYKPRELSERQIRALKRLARQVMTQLELRRAMRKLDTGNLHLNGVLGSATDYAIIATDAANRITHWNKGAETILGWTAAEAIGQSAAIIFTPEDRAAGVPASEMARADADGRATDERTHLRKDGSRFFGQGALTLLRNGRQHEGYLKILRDRTRQRETQAALHESEARFRAITDSVEQMIWSTRPDGFHDYYNQRWYEYTGVTPGSTDGEGWNDIFHPDDQARAWDVWRRSLATGAPYHIEYRLRHRSGQYRWVLGRAQPVRDEAGRIVRWYGTCTDIQEIVEAREVLARSREELERLVEARTADRDRMWRLSTDVMLVARFDGTVTAVNPAWTALLGWSEGELIGGSFLGLVHPDDMDATAAEAQKLAAGQTTLRFENRYRRKDGDYRWMSWTAVPDRDFIHAVGRDVTAEKEAQAELARAQEALRQAQKMEAVGQLTGGIAHDFNNMLAVVIGSLDLLGRRIGTADARARRYVEAAADGARRAALLTQRLLAFSRQQPLKPEPVDANKLVAGMSDLLRGSLGSDVRLETVLAGGLWRTHADPNQLENVLLNLAVNARDAMPEGGRLTIETQNAHLDARYAVAHLGVPAGQYVMIAVTDTGSGMPPEVIAKAFDPFFTTKAVGKGTGLGLSQVYGFVKQSGGHVKIYSEPGQGTTVKVYLPRYIAADSEAADAAPEPDIPLGEPQEVVLVVEDEPAVRQFSVDALGELGYRVLEADGAAAALRFLDAHPEIALLFTDVVMPDVNGRKLADEARRRRPDLRILFTTGYTRNAVVHNGVLDPGVQLIGKPFTIEELAAKVREVLDSPVTPIGG